MSECKEVSPKLMWVRLKVGTERWVIVSAYEPGSEECGREGIFLGGPG